MLNQLRGMALFGAFVAAAGAHLVAGLHAAPRPGSQRASTPQLPPCGGGLSVSDPRSWLEWKERFATAVDEALRSNAVRRSREGALVEFVVDNKGDIISLEARSGVPNRKPTPFVDQVADAVRAVARSLPFPETRPQVVQLQLRADSERVFPGAHSQKILPCAEPPRVARTGPGAQGPAPAFQRARQMGLVVFPGAVPIKGDDGGTRLHEEPADDISAAVNVERSQARFEASAPMSEVIAFYRAQYRSFREQTDGGDTFFSSGAKLGENAVIRIYTIRISRSNAKTIIQLTMTTV
jgi:hypothetical protein